jgi:hypothetical protein
VVLALIAGGLALRPRLERAIRERIESAAAHHGLTAKIETVRVGLWPPVRLRGVSISSRSRWQLTAEMVEGWWRGGLVVNQAFLQGPAGVTVAAKATEWDFSLLGGDDFRARLLLPRSGLILSRTSDARETRWSFEAEDLPVGEVFDLKRSGQPVLDSGTIRGSGSLTASQDQVLFKVDLAARSARLPALAETGSKRAAMGRRTQVVVKLGGTWKPEKGVLEVPAWSARIEGAAASGSLTVHDLQTDPLVDLALDMERVDFARLLRTWGLNPPESLGQAAGDLGSATLSAAASGRVSSPESFEVSQKLDFTPPPQMPSGIARLRGDFVHEVSRDSGPARRIDVSPSSPDFIPLAEVPPLFLRALLIAEDAGFYGHPGIDLREVPAALITDWSRGGAARGASTITQQLAKNLFLSHEKQLGRKLQELSLTFLMEAALSKQRILEIYVNVIEWGPDLYGLRPAARVYFSREPAELTPARMAFLISIIPGPLKYQSSFARGTPGPGLRKLVDNLLAKLRSVDALTEEEYQKALAEEIVVEGRGAGPPEAPAAEPGTSPSPQ